MDGSWNRILEKDWRKGHEFCRGGDDRGNRKWRGKAFFEVNGKSIASDRAVNDGQSHDLAGTCDRKT
jgi:hypothetical protein